MRCEPVVEPSIPLVVRFGEWRSITVPAGVQRAGGSGEELRDARGNILKVGQLGVSREPGVNHGARAWLVGNVDSRAEPACIRETGHSACKTIGA